MRNVRALLMGLALALSACGGTSPSNSAAASRPIIISSTNTPGPPLPTPSGAPAAPVSTILTPFATTVSAQPTAAALQTPVPSGNPNQVRIQDFGFTPPTLSVTVGTQVTWVNGGPSNHTVTANDGSFDAGTIQRNASFNFTFTKAGTFAYHCSIHPTMTASVTVT
jgi:plastocyanin